MSINKAGGAGAEALRQVEQQQQLREQQDLETADSAGIEERRAREGGSAGQAGAQAPNDMQVKETSPDDAVGEVGEASKTGVEKHDEAVDVASAQQDRGESWQDFSSTAEATEIPPSVEDMARDDADQAEAQEKIKVEDLLKEMTLNSGKIKS